MTGVNRDGTLTVAPEASHFAAGCGARTYADGVDTGGIIINTTANIPSIEETEEGYPILYLFRRQLTDSGGAGRFRGGVSGEVAITPYDAAGGLSTSFAGVGTLTPNAVGLAGGVPGATVRYLRFPGANALAQCGALTRLPGTLCGIPGERIASEPNQSRVEFPVSTVEYHNWQGGGGFGDPLDRELDRVSADLVGHLVSIAEAERVYGVVATADGKIDKVATTRMRDARRKERLLRARPYVERYPLVLADSHAPVDEALPSEGEDASSAAVETRVAEPVRYWDLIESDPAGRMLRCVRCDHALGAVGSDYRSGCVSEEVPAWQAGRIHGQDYLSEADKPPVVLRMFYCPGCGRQFEADLVMPGDIGPSAIIAGASNTSPTDR